jgi:hypothetical protein
MRDCKTFALEEGVKEPNGEGYKLGFQIVRRYHKSLNGMGMKGCHIVVYSAAKMTRWY